VLLLRQAGGGTYAVNWLFNERCLATNSALRRLTRSSELWQRQGGGCQQQLRGAAGTWAAAGLPTMPLYS
jgi:hypothetical protein